MTKIGKHERLTMGSEPGVDKFTPKRTRLGTYGSRAVVYKTSSRRTARTLQKRDIRSSETATNRVVARDQLQSASLPSTDPAPILSHQEVADESTPAELSPAPSALPIKLPLWECATCTEVFEEEQFPFLKACPHKADACRACFGAWVSEQLDTRAWYQLTCQSSGCSTRLTQDDLQLHVSAEVFER